jgi:phosphate uptake regulator
MVRSHIDKEYDLELRKVREGLLVMGGKVEEMLEASMRALV